MTGRTVGVSVSVPAPHGAQLDQVRRASGSDDGQMPAHLTVLPPVDVDETALASVVEHLEAVGAATTPFEVQLAGTGTFRPVSPVVFVSVANGSAALVALERAVRRGALGVDSRFAFHPHVTVAHDLADEDLDRVQAELAAFHARIRVAGIDLHERRDGAWNLLRTFAFGGVSP